MGLGLNIQSEGTHIAFTAGTGILAFIDLVAHLILRILFEKSNAPNIIEEVLKIGGDCRPEMINLNKFRFELFTSTNSEDQLSGVALINCLINLCEKYEMTYLFKHIQRYSINNDPHWNQDFFVNKFLEYEKINRGNQTKSI